MQVLLFNYADFLKSKSNPRLLAYYTYLEKQGKSPCFCFLKSTAHQETAYHSKSFGNANLLGFLNTFWGLINAFFYILNLRQEVIYIYGSHLIYAPIYLICKIKGTILIIEKNELDSSKSIKSIKDAINYPMYKLDEWLIVKLRAKLVVITQKLFDYYQSKGLQHMHITGLFLPEINHQSKEESDTTHFTIGYLGSFADKDDLGTLLEALSKVAPDIPHLELTLIGKPNMSYFKGKYPFKIFFLGELDNQAIIPHLQTCKVLISIRKKDAYSTYGFPSKLGEYFLTEVPIICSDNILLPEEFYEENAIAVVRTENPKELGQTIDYLYRNPSIAQKMGKKGHELAKHYFNHEVLLKRWFEFFVS